jgi:hypothetical protein
MTPNSSTPRIAMLGWCDRASKIQGLHPALGYLNIQALSFARISYIFPFDMYRATFVLAIYEPRLNETFRIEFRHSDGSKAFELQVTLNSLQVLTIDGSEQVDSLPASTTLGWRIAPISFEQHVTIFRPDDLSAFLIGDESEQFLATFHLLHASAPPYTPDQIAALRTDPLARTIVKLGMSCPNCGGSFKTYAALERNPKMEAEGFVWYADLGAAFACTCNQFSFSLEYLRTGLHGMLSRSLTRDDQVSSGFVRLYEITKLEEDCREFKALIESETNEQSIQSFLEAHPVFFARFSPHRLINKPKILTKYVADFAILNARKELLLIEIERSNIRLLTREGAVAAELQHAVSQVTNWIQEVSDFKTAVLDSLHIELREVAIVRGVVIAGRSPHSDDEGRALRRAFTGNVEFYTFDDLLRDTTGIIRGIANA